MAVSSPGRPWQAHTATSTYLAAASKVKSSWPTSAPPRTRSAPSSSNRWTLFRVVVWWSGRGYNWAQQGSSVAILNKTLWPSLALLVTSSVQASHTAFIFRSQMLWHHRSQCQKCWECTADSRHMRRQKQVKSNNSSRSTIDCMLPQTILNHLWAQQLHHPHSGRDAFHHTREVLKVACPSHVLRCPQ